MATSSTADSATSTRSDAETASDTDAGPRNDDDATSIADRLRTVGTVVWATFLAAVVVFTLIPAVALWFGAVPFDPPPPTPYFAFVGGALAGTAVLVLAAVYDV